MHPDTKKAISGQRKSALKSDKAKGLLLDIPMFPGIDHALSNISGSSGNNSEAPAAFAAYEKYRDNSDAHSHTSHTSHVSFESQDTFTTFSEGKGPNVWGHQQICPSLFSCLNFKLSWLEHVVKSRHFKRLSITLILLNCLLAAVGTADFVTENSHTEYYFNLGKDFFVYVMSVELFIQFIANGISFFANGWLMFDFIFVGLAWVMPNLLVVRTFRVVRTLRLASWVKDLKELVVALLLVIPKMFAIFFLLMILFLIFSILFTDLFKHTYDDGITQEDYFSRIDITLFTLFQIMTLDGWAEICKEIMVAHPWAWAPFVAFVVVSSFFFLNLVIAVVCDAVTSVHRDTVVKYIQDDISAATSVREALKVEDRLEELAGSMQLMMQAQITVLEGLQVQQERITRQHPGSSSPKSQAHDEKMRRTTQQLREELQSTFYGPLEVNSDLTPVTGNHARIDMGENTVLDVPELPSPLRKFDSKRGPSTPGFWYDIGLTDDQVARVMARLEAQGQRLEYEQLMGTSVIADAPMIAEATPSQETTSDAASGQSSPSTTGIQHRPGTLND